jgi:tRNA (guanine-N7-)-methyltransferase
MSKNKLQKFAELEEFSNVFQRTQKDAKGKLNEFLKDKPTILELACGRGEYTLALAKMFPDKSFIGIDYQGERLWFGSKKAQKEKLSNVRFLRIYVEELLEYFKPNSINEIWITFPDPFPKKRHTKKRLTFERFLAIYKKVLKPKGVVRLKTDDKNFFEYSLESIKEFGGKILEKLEDIYKNKVNNPLLYVQTHYEKKHLKNKKAIYYLKFSV